MTMKTEGRTQLVGYAMQNRLVASITEARKMELGKLRDIVGLHREAMGAMTQNEVEAVPVVREAPDPDAWRVD